MKKILISSVFLLLSFSYHTVNASDLLMARSSQSFPETMLALQTSISEHGYKLSRVQRIDIGLTGMGYDTDKYRIVFFGKIDEIRSLGSKYPQLIPYLPIKISIFAENKETILITANPLILTSMIDDEHTATIFHRWKNDLESIFEDIKQFDNE
jgi:uncharacterized protein (DUF302 family)